MNKKRLRGKRFDMLPLPLRIEFKRILIYATIDTLKTVCYSCLRSKIIIGEIIK